MSRNTTELGRMKVQNPELGYDTQDGGAALWAALTEMFKQFSNHINGRWYPALSVTATGGAAPSVNVVHNFGVDVSMLKCLFFLNGTTLLSKSEVDATFSLSSPDTNTLRITNLTGVVKSFTVYVYAHKLKVEAEDLDVDVFATSEPGAVSSSTSGAVGTGTKAARNDHSHDLGSHAHTGTTDGGDLASRYALASRVSPYESNLPISGGYIGIGAGSPKFQVKKLTGTWTANTLNCTISHGLSGKAKIFGVWGLVRMGVSYSDRVIPGGSAGKTLGLLVDTSTIVVTYYDGAGNPVVFSGATSYTVELYVTYEA